MYNNYSLPIQNHNPREWCSSLNVLFAMHIYLASPVTGLLEIEI